MVSPPDRRRSEESRRAQLRSSQEPARIRRGDGRAAEARLQLSPANSGRRQLPRPDHRDDRPQVDEHIKQFLDPTYGSESFAAAAGNLLHVQLECQGLSQRRCSKTPSGWPSMKPAAWPSRRSSTRSKKTCPDDEEQSEWNWDALANCGQHPLGPQSARSRSQERSAATSSAEELIKTAHEAIRTNRSVVLCAATWSPTTA